MADNHYWYSWDCGQQAGTTLPTGLNAIADYLTINSTDAAIPGTNPMNIVLNVLYMQIGPIEEFKAYELDLVANKAGHHEFWACVDQDSTVDGPVNGHIFTTPITIGHKYMRELKIRTGGICHFVLQDITAKTVETWDGKSTSTKPFTSVDDGLEWHNFDSAVTFEPYWHCTATQFGYSTNGGTSYTDFTISQLKIITLSVPPGNVSWPLGDFTVNGTSGTPDTGGGTGGIYNVPDESLILSLYNGSYDQMGEAGLFNNSSFVNKNFRQVKVYLKRVGSPTGTVYCRVKDIDTLNIIPGCEAQIDASSISTTVSPYTFVLNPTGNPSPTIFLDVSIEFSGGDASNYIGVGVTAADRFEGTSTCLAYHHTSTGYNSDGTRDLTGMISTEAPTPPPGGGGGTTVGYGKANLGDIRFFYSGGEGNTVGQFSLGGAPSSHEVPTYMLDALFNDISSGDATAGVKGEYRCIYMKNISEDNTLTKLKMWFPTGGSVSPDTLLQVAVGTVNITQSVIPNITTPPSIKLTWFKENEFTLAKPYEFNIDLKPSEFIPLWLWRSARAATRPFSRDQALIEIDYWAKAETTAPPPGEETWTCPDGYTYNSVDKLCHLTSGGGGTTAVQTGHGVKLFYSPKAGGEKFELMRMSQSDISQVDFQSSCREFSGTQPNVAFKVSSQDQVRVEVGTRDTHGGFDDKSAIDNLDPVHLRTTGYMATNKDWRNYEAQWYLMVHSYSGSTSSGEAHMELEGRCGYNDTDSTSIGSPSRGRYCESTKYNANAYFTGRVKFEKCIEHTNGYSSSNPEKTGALSPAKWTGVWTGFKQVCYNIPNSTSVNNHGPKVKIELYADQGPNSGSTPSNQWKKVIEAIDDGSGSVFSGPRNTYHCGGDDPKMPVSWGGPLLIFRWDHLDAEFKWLSVYELDPAIVPAGSASLPPTVPPIPGGGNQPPDTTPQGSAKLHYLMIAHNPATYDKIMISLSAQIIQSMTDPEDKQGSRGLVVYPGGDYSYGISGYCAQQGSGTGAYITGEYGSNPNDEHLCAYWDDSVGKCVTPGANKTSGSKTGSKGIIADDFGPRLDQSPKIFLIFWGQIWNTQTDPMSKATIEQKVRDYLLNRDSVYWSRLSQYSVQPPKWGASCVNTTTPIPTGTQVDYTKFQQCAIDAIKRGLIESPVVNSGNSIYAVITPVDKNSLVNETGATGSTDFSVTDYDSAMLGPGHHDASGGSTTLFQIIGQVGPNTTRSLYSGATTRFGYVVNADSIMLNEDPLTLIGFYLAKTGAPTGTIYYRIRDNADVVQVEFASLSCADIVSTSTPELHLLRNEANTYKLQQGDKITVEYTGGSVSAYIKVDEVQDNSNFEGSPTCSISYTGASWTQTTAKCPAGELWSGYALDATLPSGTALGSTGGPPVPDTIILDVTSSATPNQLGASKTYQRAGEVAANGSSVLVGAYITKIGAWLKRAGSPTGSVYARIYNAAGTLSVDFGAVDITTISNSVYQQVIWEKDDNYNIYAMASGDRVVIEYTGGDSSNYLNQDEQNSDLADGTNTISTRYAGTTWSTYTTKEACMKLWTSSGAGGGGSPPPPPAPFTTVYDVSVSGGSHLSFSSSQAVQGEYIQSGSSLIGKVLTRITYYVNRWSGGSGNLICTIRDSSNNIKATIATVAVSSLANNDNDQPVVFTNTANTYAIAAGDFVAIYHDQHDGSIDGCRGSNSVSNAYVKWNDNSSSWGSSSSNDYCGTMETGGV